MERLSLASVCTMIDREGLVNGSAYMDFREATDELFARVDHAELASALGVSVPLIRQARLKDDAAAHRTPPKDWPEAVIQMSEKRIMRYRKLIQRVQASMKAEVQAAGV